MAVLSQERGKADLLPVFTVKCDLDRNPFKKEQEGRKWVLFVLILNAESDRIGKETMAWFDLAIISAAQQPKPISLWEVEKSKGMPKML